MCCDEVRLLRSVLAVWRCDLLTVHGIWVTVVWIRVRELQVVASKRDIETPPIQDLHVRSVRVWDAPVN